MDRNDRYTELLQAAVSALGLEREGHRRGDGARPRLREPYEAQDEGHALPPGDVPRGGGGVEGGNRHNQ